MQSSSEVWRAITAVGIAGADTCRDWAAQIAATLPPEDLASGPKTLACLVEKGQLSAYQAKIVGQNAPPSQLRIGHWLIRQPVDSPLWNAWFVAKDTSQPDNNSSWVRAVDSTNLAGLEPCQASAERLQRLAKFQHAGVQRVYASAFNPSGLVTAVAPAEGTLLADVGFSLTSDQKREILIPITEAVAALHAAGIVHGRISPDRVLISGDKCTLVIDPLCGRTAMPSSVSSGLIGRGLGKLRIEHFLAPEFISPDPTPSMASDVYSLGCLWWWLIHGTAVTQSQGKQVDSADAIMSRQSAPLPAIKNADSLSAEQAACLKHALARNLDARFPDAGKLLAAFRAAQTSLITASNTPAKKPQADADTPKRSKLSLPAKATGKQRKEATKEKTQPAPEKNSTQAKAPVPPPVPPAPLVEKPAAVKPPPKETEISEEQVKTQVVAPTAIARPATTAENKPAGSTRSRTRPRKKAKGNKWVLPVAGGCGFLIVLLAILNLSGALQPSPPEQAKGTVAPYQPSSQSSQPKPDSFPPAAAAYNVVSSESATLWLPPALPKPLPVDLLPPGAQLFVSVKPEWISSENSPVARALGARLDPLRDLLQRHCSLAAISQATLAFYPPLTRGQLPQVAVRYQLNTASDPASLAGQWSGASEAIVDGRRVYASDETLYYFNEPLETAAGGISDFACGPIALMQTVVEFGGEAGPMTPAIEQLWEQSDADADFVAFGAPQFLFTEGRELLNKTPKRFSSAVRNLLATDRRAALLQTRFLPDWYTEVAVSGRTTTAAGPIAEQISASVTSWSQGVEQWFVDESPHPAWRAIALRYPQMIRRVNDSLRHGVEDGVAKANFYLPSTAAPNIVLASWLAAQDGATQAVGTATTPIPTAGPPLTTEQYLDRPIRLSFAQEPIEVALSLVGEEANDDLPEGTQPMRFELDGDAFELAGITRNQQLSDFQHNGSTVRKALTDIARRGNPITTVQDTREEDQQLIWLVRSDPDNPGRSMVSLTTRTAATSRGDTLTAEFSTAEK